MSVFAVSLASDLNSLLDSFSAWSEQFDGQALPTSSILLTESSCAKILELMREVRPQSGLRKWPVRFESQFALYKCAPLLTGCPLPSPRVVHYARRLAIAREVLRHASIHDGRPFCVRLFEIGNFDLLALG